MLSHKAFMKAFKLHSPKSLDNFKLADYYEPVTGEHQVKIAVKAVSLNFRDYGLATGMMTYPGERLPFVPFSDCSGEITEVGNKVQDLKIGDRVAASFFPEWQSGPFTREKTIRALGGTQDGVLAEYIVANENAVAKIPTWFSYAEAATFPCAAVTAWHGLVVQQQIKAGDTVLLLGTGGVSIFGLQIAKMHGARTIITSGSNDKLERAKALGADFLVNYKEDPNWKNTVKEITNGLGADCVLDVVGRLSDTLAVIRPGGSIYLIGKVGGAATDDQPNLRQVTTDMLRLQGLFVGSCDMLTDVFQAFAKNELKPVISETYNFADARQALHDMGEGTHFGKIIVKI